MERWFSLNLGDAMLAVDALLELEKSFENVYDKRDYAGCAALFMRHESEGRLQCEVIVYFSPAASRLAEMVDADPCARPSPDSLSLYAGDEACWQLLFPETAARRDDASSYSNEKERTQ